MVVSRKKSDSRGAKRNSINTLPGNRNGHQTDKYKDSLQSSGIVKEWAGPSVGKVLKGKRKAHAEIYSSPTRDPIVDVPIKPFSCEVGSEQSSHEGAGRTHIEKTKLKSKASSVKGKKNFAQNRASLSLSSPIVVTSKDKLTFSPNWSLSIAKIQTDVNGEFKFGANPKTEMGDQCRRDDIRSFESDYRGNPGTLNSAHGLVQRHTPTSMEASSSVINASYSGQNARDTSHCDNLEGGFGALADTYVGQMSDERSGEDDRMEVGGGSEAPSSN